MPAYRQMRIFALQRIRKLKARAETFNPVQVDDDPFKVSLGPFAGGKAEHVEVEFSPAVAPYIEERQWHPSQQLARLDDGAVVLKMDVAIDFSLRSWMLGFGHHARVLQPSRLALEMLEEFEEAREQYAPRMALEAEAVATAAADRRQLSLLSFAPGSMAVSYDRPPRRVGPRRTSYDSM